MTSTICNGPNVADYATGITSATGCKAECDKHAGCVNALYAPLTGNCFLRGQCEDMHTDNKYDLYQLDNAGNFFSFKLFLLENGAIVEFNMRQFQFISILH